MEWWHFCDGLRYHSQQQNVAITVLWHSWAPLNLDGDKSRVFYCEFNSNSKTVSTKSDNLHVDSKLPQQLHVALHYDGLLHLGRVQWGPLGVTMLPATLNTLSLFTLWFANIVQSKAPNSRDKKIWMWIYTTHIHSCPSVSFDRSSFCHSVPV